MDAAARVGKSGWDMIFARLPVQIVLLSVVGALLYGHTLHAPWYFDDASLTSGALQVEPGRTASLLFTQRGFARLSFVLNHRLGGLDPFGYHLVNIAIHLAAATLVLLLLRRVFPRQGWAPCFGALVFVAHPLQTQAVTYVVQRMTSLSALCCFAALYLFVRGRELLAGGLPFHAPRHLACYLGGIVAGLLAVLAKENAIILPCALLLFARFFPNGTDCRWRPLLGYVAPYCLAPLGFGLYYAAPLLTGAVAIEQLANSRALANMAGNSPLRYLVTEFSVLWIYIRLLFLPFGQALDYGYPLTRELVTLRNVAAFSGLAALALLAIRLRHRQPAISAGILWFFLALAVESSFIPLDPLFEHRLYLPLFGFSILLTALVGMIPVPTLRQGTMTAVILLLALLTWRRNALWNDPIALYEDNLRRAPQNERVCNDLASYYLQKGRSPALAKPLLERCLQINPRYQDAYKTLADIYVQEGRHADARRLLEAAVRLFPWKSSFLEYLAWLHAQAGENGTAFELLRRAQLADPANGAIAVNLGRLALQLGDAVTAERALRQGIARGAAGVETYHALAQALQRQGRSSEAAQQLDIARSLEGKESRQDSGPPR